MRRATHRHLLYVREFLRLNSPRVGEPWFHEAVTAVLAERDAAAERDARQRAEIRRHRRNMETLRLLTCKCATLSGLTCAPCRYVREALAPKRRARK